MSKSEKLIWGLLILITIFTGISAFKTPTGRFGDSGTGQRFSTVTNTSATLSNASSVIVARNAGRNYLRLTNDDATINEWVCLASTCAASTGIKLTPGTSFTLDLSNNYVGDVSAIAASATPVIDIVSNP